MSRHRTPSASRAWWRRRPVLVVAALVTTVAALATTTAPAGAQQVDDRVVGTELVVAPSGTSVRGEAVTITVGIVPADGGAPELVTGFVRISDTYRGVRSEVATLPIEDGLAQMTTTDLLPGRHHFTARFLPNDGFVPGRGTGADHHVRPAACPAPGAGGHGAVVQLVYAHLLGRCPDPAGFAHWVDRLAGGTSPGAFARAIAATPEAVGWVVDDAYRTMLGRSADQGGRAFWVRYLQRHGRYDQLLAALGASREFWVLAGGTDEGFVTRVYDRILDRAPDRVGFTYWVGWAVRGSRQDLIQALANLDEPLARLVALAYDEILGRAPTDIERFDGVGFLRATGDRSGLYARLIGRPEFSALA